MKIKMNRAVLMVNIDLAISRLPQWETNCAKLKTIKTSLLADDEFIMVEKDVLNFIVRCLTDNVFSWEDLATNATST